jgi:hypothetical protein
LDGVDVTFLKKTKELLGSLVELLRRQKKTVLLVLVVATVTLLLSSMVSIWLSNIDDVRFPSIGTIRTSGIKAYWDAELTNEADSIPWGELHPGSESNVTLYLRSISNIQITLNMTTENWTFNSSRNEIVYGPANSTKYMTLSWDYNGSILNPGQVTKTVLALRVEGTTEFVEFLIEKDVQLFSLDINVKAIEN